MNWPVVHDEVDRLGLWVQRAYLTETASQSVCGDPLKVPNVNSRCCSVHQPHHPHHSVGGGAIAHLRLTAPHACPEPRLGWLTIEADLVGKQDPYPLWVLSCLSEGLVQGPFFSSYSGSGEWRCGWPRLYRYPIRLSTFQTPISLKPFRLGTVCARADNVHRVWVRPKALGDCRRYRSTSVASAFGFRPRPGRMASPSNPPSLNLCTQLLILVVLTPRKSATSRPVLPLPKFHSAVAFVRMWGCVPRRINPRSCSSSTSLISIMVTPNGRHDISVYQKTHLIKFNTISPRFAESANPGLRSGGARLLGSSTYFHSNDGCAKVRFSGNNGW